MLLLVTNHISVSEIEYCRFVMFHATSHFIREGGGGKSPALDSVRETSDVKWVVSPTVNSFSGHVISTGGVSSLQETSCPRDTWSIVGKKKEKKTCISSSPDISSIRAISCCEGLQVLHTPTKLLLLPPFSSLQQQPYRVGRLRQTVLVCL